MGYKELWATIEYLRDTGILPNLKFWRLKAWVCHFLGSFIDSFQMASSISKLLWRLSSWSGAVTHASSNNKGVRDIGNRISIVLDTKKSFWEPTVTIVSNFVHYDTLLHNATDLYYKKRQKFVTKHLSFFVTKYNSFITKHNSYKKMCWFYTK